MQYFISFIEGIITFISPCLLPMLPVYVSYFAGGGERSTKKTLADALGFVLGFTVVFIAMGALAGTVGSFVKAYGQVVNIVCGGIVIVFGLNYIGLLKIPFFRGRSTDMDLTDLGFLTSVLFGMVFSIGWTPCVGAFLGSALLLASQQGHVVQGMVLLFCYSLGLGIPFVFSAVLVDKLKTTFDFIKKNYKIINVICGILLIAVGILMASGMMGKLLALMG